MSRKETNETHLKNIKRAHDTLHGCILGLPVSEGTRGILLDQLRILYEFSVYPIVAPSANQRASSSPNQGSASVYGAGDTESGEAAEVEER